MRLRGSGRAPIAIRLPGILLILALSACTGPPRAPLASPAAAPPPAGSPRLSATDAGPPPAPTSPVPVSFPGRIAYILEQDVWVVDGRNPDQPERITTLHRSSAPAWSPDGRWLSFVHRQVTPAQGQAVLQVGQPGGEWRAVLGDVAAGWPQDGGVLVARWSPDSSRIALTVQDAAGGPPQLWVTAMGAEGAQPPLRVHLPAEPLDFAWAPDGRGLVVAARTPDAGAPVLIQVSPDGKEPIELLRPRSDPTDGARSGLIRHPVWSPDGHWLAYFLVPLSASLAADGVELHMLSVADPVPRLLGRTLAYPDWLAWDPDGRGLLFVRLQEGKAALMWRGTNSRQSGPAAPQVDVPDSGHGYYNWDQVFAWYPGAMSVPLLADLDGDGAAERIQGPPPERQFAEGGPLRVTSAGGDVLLDVPAGILGVTGVYAGVAPSPLLLVDQTGGGSMGMYYRAYRYDAGRRELVQVLWDDSPFAVSTAEPVQEEDRLVLMSRTEPTTAESGRQQIPTVYRWVDGQLRRVEIFRFSRAFLEENQAWGAAAMMAPTASALRPMAHQSVGGIGTKAVEVLNAPWNRTASSRLPPVRL